MDQRPRNNLHGDYRCVRGEYAPQHHFPVPHKEVDEVHDLGEHCTSPRFLNRIRRSRLHYVCKPSLRVRGDRLQPTHRPYLLEGHCSVVLGNSSHLIDLHVMLNQEDRHCCESHQRFNQNASLTSLNDTNPAVCVSTAGKQ